MKEATIVILIILLIFTNIIWGMAYDVRGVKMHRVAAAMPEIKLSEEDSKLYQSSLRSYLKGSRHDMNGFIIKLVNDGRYGYLPIPAGYWADNTIPVWERTIIVAPDSYTSFRRKLDRYGRMKIID